jgi:hypothetical protein
MKHFDTRTYSISDIEEWNDTDLLDLSPEFQRRSVWKQSAKSYLIDTVLRGRPIPKIIFTQQLTGRRNVRTVVDGQQRLRSILEYLSDAFPVSKAHNKELAGRYFSELSDEQQREFRKYEIGVDLLFDVTYEDMLDIFTRLNAYTVPLKREEKLNAQYVGFFKQAAFQCGHRFAEYWQSSRVLTAATVSRMAEAALAGDLLILLLDGPQSNKVVESYYKKLEDAEDGVSDAQAAFDELMSVIADVYPPPEMKGTIWTKVVQFYTLFGALAVLQGKVATMSEFASRASIKNRKRLRVQLDDFSEEFAAYDPESDDAEGDHPLHEYVEVSRRRTADKASREQRILTLARWIQGNRTSE